MPDAGESEAEDGKRFPSDLSKSTAIKKTADGFTYLDPAQFHEYFAADLPNDVAAFMAPSGLPLALVATTLWILVFLGVRSAFAGLLQPRVAVPVSR